MLRVKSLVQVGRRYYCTEATQVLKEPPTRLPSISGTHRHSLIFLHGHSDQVKKISGFFSSHLSKLTELDGLEIILPQAPQRAITYASGRPTSAWYDISWMTPYSINVEDTAGIEETTREIHSLITEESNKVGSNQVIVAGFSEGGAAAIFSGLSYPQTLAGIASCCGYSLTQVTVHEANRDTQVLALSGYEDPLIPYNIARASYQKLKLQHDIDLKLFTDGAQQHELNEIQLGNLTKWMKEMLK